MRQEQKSGQRPSAPAAVGRNAKVSVRGVSKRFAATLAADRIDLDIRDGEFLTLLGASGCGKTTLMRMIAGFETPESGRIFIDGCDVTDLPPRERHLGMVFQQYSLFPHMTVAENIAYGLQSQRLQARQINERVDEMLDLVQLPHLRDRRPGQLSGGQQQRVALARALATRPSVLMLDEPLGALDLKLRQQLQAELKRIHRETRTTFLFVTHDQEEALHLSDRIAVMRNGRIDQLDDPTTIYMQPVNEFVADFIGDISFLSGDYDPLAEVFSVGDVARISARLARTAGPARLAVRPEQVRLEDGPDALNAVIREVTPETGSTLLHLEIESGEPLLSRVLGLSRSVPERDQAVRITLDDCCVAFDAS